MSERPVYKFPKSLGACADRLAELRDSRKGAQEIVDSIDAEEKALKAHIIDTMPKGDTGASGKKFKVAVVVKEVPQVKDWEAFYKYVLKTKDFSLLQRRLGEAAVKERWEANKPVPGVEAFKAVTVSLTKI